MRRILLFSALFLSIGAASQAFALEGGFSKGPDGSGRRAEQTNSCADTKSRCLQNLGPWTRYPSQRSQCVISYDQCLSRQDGRL